MQKNEYLVRIGRVCWWGSIVFAIGMPILFMLSVTRSVMTRGNSWHNLGGYGWDELLVIGIACLISLLIGRAARYILANE